MVGGLGIERTRFIACSFGVSGAGVPVITWSFGFSVMQPSYPGPHKRSSISLAQLVEREEFALVIVKAADIEPAIT